MPPAARKPAAKPAEEKPVKKDGDICRRCWPDGWPSEDTPNATCEHGVWTR